MRDQTKLDRQTVLLITADEPLRGLLADLLTNDGYDVLPAEDDWVGYRLAREHRVDVAVLYVPPPIDRGLAVLLELRRHPATWHVPVVVVTTQPDSVRERDDTASRVISMPFDIDDVLVQVRRAVGYGDWARPGPAANGYCEGRVIRSGSG